MLVLVRNSAQASYRSPPRDSLCRAPDRRHSSPSFARPTMEKQWQKSDHLLLGNKIIGGQCVTWGIIFVIFRPPRIYTHIVSADKIFRRTAAHSYRRLHYYTRYMYIYMYTRIYTRIRARDFPCTINHGRIRDRRGGEATLVEKTRTRRNAGDKRSVENYTGIFDRVSTRAFIVPKCLAHRSKSRAKHRITASRYRIE